MCSEMRLRGRDIPSLLHEALKLKFLICYYLRTRSQKVSINQPICYLFCLAGGHGVPQGDFAAWQNVKSCYEPVKFTCHIGNVLAAVVSGTNIFGTE